MISDKALVRLLGSDASARAHGDLVRVALLTLVLVAIAGWIAYYVAVARMMASDLHFNDLGKFYYSARLFLDGRDMYGPSPATLMPVSGGRTHEFLNMNPPHFHLLILPVAWLTPALAATIFALASICALGFSLVVIVRELGIPITATRVLWTTLALLTFAGTGALVITGQVSLLMLAGVTLAWRAARRGQWTRCGAWLGALISVKPFLLVFVPYFVLQRQWRAVVASTVAIAGAFALGFAVFGPAAHASWMQALDATDWNWAAMNGSAMGLLSRVLRESPYYTPLAQAPHLITPLWLVSTALVGIVTLAALIRDRTVESIDRAFFLLLVGALLVSPLGWMYYLWFALGPAMALASQWRTGAGAARPSGLVRTRNVLLALAVPGLVWPLGLILLGQPAPLATLTIGSAYFWAMLFLWGAAVMGGWRSWRQPLSSVSQGADNRAAGDRPVHSAD